MNNEASDLELIITELQTRLGQIVGSYEMQLASLRVEATRQLEAKDTKISELHALMAPEPPEVSSGPARKPRAS